MFRKNPSRGALTVRVLVMAMLLIVLGAARVFADEADQIRGKIEAVNLIGAWVDAGAPEKEPFRFTGKDGKTYMATFKEDILPLFTEPNTWAPGTAACKKCHFAVSKDSAHEMDLSSYEGIMTGGDSVSKPDKPARIIIPGNWNNSILRNRLRNNRMPPGMPFDITESNRDGPVVTTKSGGSIEAVNLVGAWVDAGAPEKEPFQFTGKDGNSYEATFEEDILPLFTKPDVWAPRTEACSECHFAISKDSAHEMDLSSYQGIMTGGDSVSKPDKPAKLFTPGDWANSMLRERLRNNRMPPGMPFDITESNRDGPVIEAGRPLQTSAETTASAETEQPKAAPSSNVKSSPATPEWAIPALVFLAIVILAALTPTRKGPPLS